MKAQLCFLHGVCQDAAKDARVQPAAAFPHATGLVCSVVACRPRRMGHGARVSPRGNETQRKLKEDGGSQPPPKCSRPLQLMFEGKEMKGVAQRFH